MAENIRMPALGQTADEVTILRWLKTEGQPVRLGELLLEVETDKATLEVESAAAGVVLEIRFAAGSRVPAGEVIAVIGRPEERAAEPEIRATPVAQRMAEQHGVELGTLRGSGPGGRIEKRDVTAALAPAERVIARPTARRLARELGVDLSQVRGSGAGGLIEKRDVLATAGRPAEPVPVEAAAPGVVSDHSDIPVPRHRQAIATRLRQAAQTIPHIRLTARVNMAQAHRLLAAQRAAGLPDLTYTHLILRAAAAALRQCPRLNMLWLEDGPRYRRLHNASVGLAIAGDDHLLVATIPEPDRLTLSELVRRTAAAVERGRRGALSPADLAPAALTVSNLGMYPVDHFDAIIDPGQTAILAIGRVAEALIVQDGSIRLGLEMQVTLAVDHRVVDGAEAARFLAALKKQLESAEV